MKKTVLKIIGRVAFWLGWPLWYFYLKGTTRSRVVIAVDDRFLAAKGWLGNGKWELPGGGVHKGESIINCALREVKEETGIILTVDQLTSGEGLDVSDNGIPFRCEPFFVRLLSKPVLSAQVHEIADLKWLRARELNEKDMEPASFKIVQDFVRRNLL